MSHTSASHIFALFFTVGSGIFGFEFVPSSQKCGECAEEGEAYSRPEGTVNQFKTI